jgi:dihydrofolate reductase
MKASVNIALSVDGMIADSDGGVDWLNNQPSIEGEDFGFQAFLDSVDVMIMGRKTFEVVVSFGKEAWAYGELPVVVMSRQAASVEIPEHLKKTVSTSSLGPKALVEKLESEGYKHAYVDGGYTIRQFLKEKLIQHLNLSTVPIVLGDGIPLFSDQGPLDLKLIESKSWSNGMVQNKYEVR